MIQPENPKSGHKLPREFYTRSNVLQVARDEFFPGFTFPSKLPPMSVIPDRL